MRIEEAEGLVVLPEASAQAVPVAREFSIRRRVGFWRDALRRRMLAAADAIAVASASLGTWGISGRHTSLLFWTAVSLPMWLLLAKLHGLYDRDHRALRHLTSDELPSLITWATTGTAALTVSLALTPAGGLSAASALRFWTVMVVAAPLLRAICRVLWRRFTPPERVLIVGSGALEQATRRKFDLFRDMHVRHVGSIDESRFESGQPLSEAEGDAVLDAFPGERIDRVVLATHTIHESLITGLVARCRAHGVKFSVVPPARAMFGTAVRLAHVADLPLMEYQTYDLPRSTALLKRTMDIVLSVASLVLLAPLLAVIAISIRLTSPGPVLFTQRRAGANGKPFTLYKFRTMVCDAEERLKDVIPLASLPEPMFKLRVDPRVTTIGRFLRRTSLDELPQLINVLRGDMSLVGPRPEELALVERYAPEHRFRLEVRPGLTGPMQVFGRGELHFDERLAVERDYIENLTLGRDARILLMTVSAVFRGTGAF